MRLCLCGIYRSHQKKKEASPNTKYTHNTVIDHLSHILFSLQKKLSTQKKKTNIEEREMNWMRSLTNKRDSSR